jgi:hypothetical protein
VDATGALLLHRAHPPQASAVLPPSGPPIAPGALLVLPGSCSAPPPRGTPRERPRAARSGRERLAGRWGERPGVQRRTPPGPRTAPGVELVLPGSCSTPPPRATPLSGPQPPNGCRGVHRTAARLRVAAGGFPRATCAPGAELDLLGSCCTHPARETPQSGRTGGRACHEQLRGNGEGPSRGREGPWMPGGGVSSAWRSAPRSTRTADHRWCTAARQPRWRRARCTRTPGPGPSERQTWPARAASSCPG